MIQGGASCFQVPCACEPTVLTAPSGGCVLSCGAIVCAFTVCPLGVKTELLLDKLGVTTFNCGKMFAVHQHGVQENYSQET